MLERMVDGTRGRENIDRQEKNQWEILERMVDGTRGRRKHRQTIKNQWEILERMIDGTRGRENIDRQEKFNGKCWREWLMVHVTGKTSTDKKNSMGNVGENG